MVAFADNIATDAYDVRGDQVRGDVRERIAEEGGFIYTYARHTDQIRRTMSPQSVPRKGFAGLHLRMDRHCQV